MNRVKEIGPALFCGSWRVRDGVLSHRDIRRGVVVDLLSLGTTGKQQIVEALWNRLDEDHFSKGDRRDVANLLYVFCEVERSRREAVRRIFPERVKV